MKKSLVLISLSVLSVHGVSFRTSPAVQRSMKSIQATQASQVGALKRTDDRIQLAKNAAFTSFTTVTYEDTPQQNPDTGGAVGPMQFVTAVKGRIRSHLKDGTLDGVLNVTLDHFFDMLSDGNFVTDPHIRYDKFSQRWFIIAITANFAEESKLVLAVSDSSVLTKDTVWSFCSVSSKNKGFNPDGEPTRFFDFPSLGIDQQAVYAGMVVMDQLNRNFITSAAIVFQKSSLFSGPGAQVTIFPNLFDQETKEGAQVLQVADNFDATEGPGWLIGNNVMLDTSEQLVLYKINEPGTKDPSIEGPLTLDVPPFSQPIVVPALGSTKRLNTVDTRFGSNAVIRDNKLWTSHHIGVDNTGDSRFPSCVSRVGARVYEIDVASDPSLVQTFTLFDKTEENDKNQISYVFPAVMVNPQGDLIIASSIAGTNQFFDGTFACAKTDDIAGTIMVTNYTKSDFTFNPSQDSNKDYTLYRIGDFSGANLDPENENNFFVITEFAAAEDTWGTEVAHVMPSV